jgi:hypothetical protein
MKYSKYYSICAAVAFFIAASLPAWAQVPNILEYDGYLIEKNKTVTGSRSMEVRLYNAATGGKLVAKETIGAVKVSDGDFYFQYGNKGIAQKLSGKSDWLAVVVAGKEQSPRFQLLSVPFALRSGDAQSLKAQIDDLVAETQQVISDLSEQVEELQSQVEGLQSQVDSGSGEDTDSDGDGITDDQDTEDDSWEDMY